MRILGIGEYCDLGAMYHRLGRAGHDVRVHIERVASQDVYAGMVTRVADWKQHLDWIREAGPDGLILFESADRGKDQDALRRAGYQVIGGSTLGDRLESDRDFGQQTLRALGLPIASSHVFRDFGHAMVWLAEHGGRYVFKNNGTDTARTRNYIGQLDDGSDMLALLSLYRRQWKGPHAPDFVLMEFIEGVEVGVGAYFNGEAFLDSVCLDWEHKRFFPGDLGELTGEMGTIVSYRGADTIFEATLGRMAAQLRQGGYCGYINLNLMANSQGLWPIEFTSRFGYPGFAICEALHAESWDRIFMMLLNRDAPGFATRPGYAAGVVLTVPPFPYSHGYEVLSKGSPVTLRSSMTAAEHGALYFAEVALSDGQLMTSGESGYVGVATGTGDSVAQASEEAYALARKVVVPNLRYRNDIGHRLVEDLDRLRAWGYGV